MASIIDSFRETFCDNLSFLKLAVLAVPVYFSYILFINSTKDFTGFNILLYITIFFLFGFLIKTTNGILNEADSILPSINPFKLALAAIKGLIAIAPITIISIMLANYINSLINIIPWLDITLKSLIWIIVLSIAITSFLMFVKKERIKDAYNIKILFDKSGDLIVRIIIFTIQVLIINLIIIGFLAYTIIVLFGIGPILYAFIAYAIVYNIGVLGHYLAQIQYEVFDS